MFNEFETTVFLILGPFPEAVTGVTSGFRQSNISCSCASYLALEKSLWSFAPHKVTYSYSPWCC